MEIETKIKTDDLDGIKKKLLDLGAKFEDSIVQEDDYFKPKGKEKEIQRPGSFILRIRQQGNKAIFTLKGLTEVTGAWLEYETGIDDPEEMRKILDKAGFSKIFTINKERIPGRFGEFGICIDKVEGLGNYVEFEIISDDAEEAKAKINDLFKKLEVFEEQIEHRGYAAIISQNMGVKFEGTQG